MQLRTDPKLLYAVVLALALSCKSEEAPSSGTTPSGATASAETAGQRVAIKADVGKFEPAEVRLKQGVPAILEFTRVADSECVNAVRMPWMSEPVNLPMNQRVEIPVDTSKAGTFTYSCWMNMVHGKVVIE
jgi:plastocyanin domain-containing protein